MMGAFFWLIMTLVVSASLDVDPVQGVALVAFVMAYLRHEECRKP